MDDPVGPILQYFLHQNLGLKTLPCSLS